MKNSEIPKFFPDFPTNLEIYGFRRGPRAPGWPQIKKFHKTKSS